MLNNVKFEESGPIPFFVLTPPGGGLLFLFIGLPFLFIGASFLYHRGSIINRSEKRQRGGADPALLAIAHAADAHLRRGVSD